MSLAVVSRRRPSRPRFELKAGKSTLQFFHGDCVEVLNDLEAGSIDLVVTSPPYNLGIKYRTYRDDIPRGEYLTWTDSWVRSVARALTSSGSLFLNVGAKPTDRDMAVGHYKPINSERFVNDCHEYIFHFSPGGKNPLDRRAVGVPYQDASNIARWAAAGDGLRCRGNTWFIPYETIQSRDRDRPHPASFPSKVPENCARLHGLKRVKMMMDPFLGLGTSAVAAARLGVNFIGVELDEYYLGEAVARVKSALNA
jgi:site-specific DNA-methyltransferase (adenine-specific)